MIPETEEENTIIKSNDDAVNNKKKKTDNCKEFQALKYRTMISIGTNLDKNIENETNEEQLNNYLESESLNNKKQNWNKLSKTDKIKKIKFFIDNNEKEKYNMNDDEISQAKRFIINMLERKKITKNNELNYNEDKGEIEDFFVIQFNETNRRYTLNKEFNPQSKKNRSNTSSVTKKKTSKNKPVKQERKQSSYKNKENET